MTVHTTELDRARRYLVPVGRLLLPDEPDLVHLSLYAWNDRWDGWMTGLALCGSSVEGDALPNETVVTCSGCEAYRPTYVTVLEREAAAVAGRDRARAARAHAGDTVENGAWHTVWLEGNWSWVTKKMTTEQREYAADRVAAYSAYLAAVDGDLEREEPDGLRWWREAGR
ncbi:hypothetical protein ACF06X_33675 [Streptomyces sp. NPDC015346]|uniref:hypothetical protein n=1 Tax=Streptomyces sp. NPDC015346 TaxID=3364954 RepID=UPI003701A1ED